MATTMLTPTEVLRDHVTFELESIDRLYLNLFVPRLQTTGGAASFFLKHRAQTQFFGRQMANMTGAFVEAVDQFAEREQIPVIHFGKERKDDLFHEQLKAFHRDEGVVFIGVAQEKTLAMRMSTRKRDNGRRYSWIVKGTVMVNHYYFYCLDRDFGPFFLKLCTYFPYTGRLCINGHEYAKRQLALRGVGFEALDNGFLSCQDPALLRSLCEGLAPETIDALARKWLARLPHPYQAEDRKAGYRYELSVLQAEFSLTQVFDRPVHGRIFFEQIIRENLDIGRPEQVALVFDRRIPRKLEARFRTRVITDGVVPSLHLDYKKTRIKQYFKEGRALRTETTINNTRDFGIGRMLSNLPLLRQIGFPANRRLLDVQRVAHDCMIGQDTLETLARPLQVDAQRAPALPFHDPRVQALLSVLVLFCIQPQGFRAKELRAYLAPLLGLDPATLSQGRISYDLRRLRLRGLIERIPKTARYRVTSEGLRIAMFYTRTWSSILRPGLSMLAPPGASNALKRAFEALEQQIAELARSAKLAA